MLQPLLQYMKYLNVYEDLINMLQPLLQCLRYLNVYKDCNKHVKTPLTMLEIFKCLCRL